MRRSRIGRRRRSSHGPAILAPRSVYRLAARTGAGIGPARDSPAELEESIVTLYLRPATGLADGELTKIARAVAGRLDAPTINDVRLDITVRQADLAEEEPWSCSPTQRRRCRAADADVARDRPRHRQHRLHLDRGQQAARRAARSGRRVGLVAAMGTRIGLLLFLSWVIGLTDAAVRDRATTSPVATSSSSSAGSSCWRKARGRSTADSRATSTSSDADGVSSFGGAHHPDHAPGHHLQPRFGHHRGGHGQSGPHHDRGDRHRGPGHARVFRTTSPGFVDQHPTAEDARPLLPAAHRRDPRRGRPRHSTSTRPTSTSRWASRSSSRRSTSAPPAVPAPSGSTTRTTRRARGHRGRIGGGGIDDRIGGGIRVGLSGQKGGSIDLAPWLSSWAGQHDDRGERLACSRTTPAGIGRTRGPARRP